MKITVIGSHLCPDTLAALNKLSAVGADIDFKDILSCHADLKEYLKLRDTNALYDSGGKHIASTAVMACKSSMVAVLIFTFINSFYLLLIIICPYLIQ
ncbi:hypothetical protein [Clostridium botulinum]|uniref:hypothetical protein n=1 Tax=Clostridium botulinum TaxID=1491 RepID=UPI00325AFFD4